jgi:hypothetical protein
VEASGRCRQRTRAATRACLMRGIHPLTLGRTRTPLKDATKPGSDNPIDERPEGNDESPAEQIWRREHPLIRLKIRKAKFAGRPEREIDGSSNDGRQQMSFQYYGKRSRAKVSGRKEWPELQSFRDMNGLHPNDVVNSRAAMKHKATRNSACAVRLTTPLNEAATRQIDPALTRAPGRCVRRLAVLALRGYRCERIRSIRNGIQIRIEPLPRRNAACAAASAPKRGRA